MMTTNTNNNVTVNASKDAMELALSIATIDEIEAYFHVDRNSMGFCEAIATLNRAVYASNRPTVKTVVF